MARSLKNRSSVGRSIGERIATLRADRRMTLEQLAKATGFTYKSTAAPRKRSRQ